ncbi:MAG: hypothetical protein HY702_00745, partial [Gemmatimonadetes bacterium]|nr:hypothetical protein [Gemmatimonadota bacterium]
MPGYFLVGAGVTMLLLEDGAIFSDGGTHLEPTFSAAAGLDLNLIRRGFA